MRLRHEAEDEPARVLAQAQAQALLGAPQTLGEAKGSGAQGTARLCGWMEGRGRGASRCGQLAGVTVSSQGSRGASV